MHESVQEPGADTACIASFLHEIGLSVRVAELREPTFLPGVTLESNGLVVDPAKLLYPGDLLHEAGHLAVMTPDRRASCNGDAGTDMGDEIGAQCWAYAAAVHLGLPPEVVFHEHGYKGSAKSLAANFRDHHVGVSLLQWMGLTLDGTHSNTGKFDPYIIRSEWLSSRSRFRWLTITRLE